MTDPSGTDDMDTALLRRIAEGDVEAIGELYDRHAGILYGLILHVLRDETEAEHVLQDVFVEVREQVDSHHRRHGTVTAWLVGMARHRAVARLRARPPHPRRRERDEAASPSHGVKLARGLEQQAAAAAMSSLPAEQRHLIEQAFYLGFDHIALAARHRLPIGIVESRIRAGMEVLVDQLPNLGGGERS
jgi:RNA polymerase sigma-70 factor (ECF subfamily)